MFAGLGLDFFFFFCCGSATQSAEGSNDIGIRFKEEDEGKRLAKVHDSTFVGVCTLSRILSALLVISST